MKLNITFKISKLQDAGYEAVKENEFLKTHGNIKKGCLVMVSIGDAILQIVKIPAIIIEAAALIIINLVGAIFKCNDCYFKESLSLLVVMITLPFIIVFDAVSGPFKLLNQFYKIFTSKDDIKKIDWVIYCLNLTAKKS